jgi:hypothetical protein
MMRAGIGAWSTATAPMPNVHSGQLRAPPNLPDTDGMTVLGLVNVPRGN